MQKWNVRAEHKERRTRLLSAATRQARGTGSGVTVCESTRRSPTADVPVSRSALRGPEHQGFGLGLKEYD
ncbi:hypothetical protein SKAU_G00238540 [Synaphobranchus kaupii]|uniref:Uncharacterized protein n=1 Tax=Synaphobranchus kaupii TaxID=118154 RepID=A0A9Q1F761_SYNKA|nr:hypothetical protein SKAU_G00238540 [Synaphobranchus kaupii]